MLARDQTVKLLRDGYRWGLAARGGRPSAHIRFLGRRAVVVGGAQGVRRFYDPRLRRRGALPAPLRLVLFGPGAVHGLDDQRHIARKALFLEVLTPDAVGRLGADAEREWAAAAARWPARGEVDVFDEAVSVLAASVLPWAGIAVPAREATRRGRQLAQIVAGFGRPGGPYLRAVTARVRANHWARRLIEGARRGKLVPDGGTALAVMSQARDEGGQLLEARTAATELLNILRPAVAVAWLVAYAAAALCEHAEWRDRIAAGDLAAAAAFAQEVRRYYPFTPALAARAREDQDVLGVRVRRGGFVVLDVYGTDHDSAYWTEPERFDPGRFLRGTFDPDALVPQGGGDVTTGHRCPGEPLTLEMLTVAVRALSRAPVAGGDGGGVDLTQMPPPPPRRLLMSE